jgi:hypothetical protein
LIQSPAMIASLREKSPLDAKVGRLGVDTPRIAPRGVVFSSGDQT